MKKSEFFKKQKLLQVMLVTALSFFAMAFSPSQTPAVMEWALLASAEGVNAYAMVSDCSGQSKYLIKIENTSIEVQSVKVTYELKGSQAYGPRTESFVLQPLESKEGSCKTGKVLVLPDYENTPGSTSEKVMIEIVRNLKP